MIVRRQKTADSRSDHEEAILPVVAFVDVYVVVKEGGPGKSGKTYSIAVTMSPTGMFGWELARMGDVSIKMSH